jgi:aerobic carbon-monoxide dehydrogenase small subunit
MEITVTVNGVEMQRAVEPRTLLIHFLRDELDLTGAHVGCNSGQCGCCTISMNDRPVKSCMVFAVQADGASITTIEGIRGPAGAPHSLQQAFRECDAVECGFCTPGMIMAAYGLVESPDRASTEEIQDRIGGNLCRCTGYRNIVRAIAQAQELRQAGEAAPDIAPVGG